MRTDYSQEPMQLVKVKGIECEFTDIRLDRNSIPVEKFMYEVAGDDDIGDTPVRVKPAILVNFYGTLVCDQELPLGEDGVLWLENEEDFEFVYEDEVMEGNE